MFNKRQREIMQAAMDIVGHDGIKALTISNIAKKVSLTEGAIYRHFSSKDEIIRNILNTIFLTMTQRIGEIITRNDKASSKLKNIVEFILHNVKENPAYEALLFAEEFIFGNDAMRVLIYNVLNTIQLYINQVLEQGQTHNEIRADVDVKDISLLFIGAIRVLVMKWKLSGYQLDIEVEGQKLYTTITRLIEVK